MILAASTSTSTLVTDQRATVDFVCCHSTEISALPSVNQFGTDRHLLDGLIYPLPRQQPESGPISSNIAEDLCGSNLI